MIAKETTPTIIFDMDGVCLDYTSAFFRYMGAEHGVLPDVMREKVCFFDLRNHLGVAGRELSLRYLLNNFASSNEFTNISPVEGMAALLSDLRKAGVRLKSITSCGGLRVREARLRNMRRVLEWQDDEELITLEFGEAKGPHLQKLGGEHVLFVDDVFKNIAQAREVGVSAIWFKDFEGARYRDLKEGSVPEFPVVGASLLRLAIAGWLGRDIVDMQRPLH